MDSERGLRSRGPDFRTAVRGERRPPGRPVSRRGPVAVAITARRTPGPARRRDHRIREPRHGHRSCSIRARCRLEVRGSRFGPPPHSRPPRPHCPPGSSTPAPLPDTLVSGSIAVLTAGSNTAAPPPVTLRWGSPLPGPPVRASRSGPPPHTARRGRAARRIEHPRLRRSARSFPAPAPPRPGVEYAGSGTGHAPPGLAVAGAAGSSLAVRPVAALPPVEAAPLAGSSTPAPPPGTLVSGSIAVLNTGSRLPARFGPLPRSGSRPRSGPLRTRPPPDRASRPDRPAALRSSPFRACRRIPRCRIPGSEHSSSKFPSGVVSYML